MTEIIELHPLKTVKSRRSHKQSFTLTAVQSSSDSSDDDSSSNDDESPVVLQLKSKSSKASKRKNMIQTLPVIINTQPTKQKKKHRQKHVQQFVINTQSPSSPKTKEILIQPVIEPVVSSTYQYIPVSAPTASLRTIVERKPCAYRPVYTPTLIEEYPHDFYNSCEVPVRRIVRRYPSNTRSVHLPKHAKKIVNRFLSGMEHAHGCRYGDECDSDHSIDDCRVCRRLRSAMDDGRRKTHSEINIYRGSRVLFDTNDSHRHRHDHSKHCKVCHLLDKSDLVISTTDDHSKTITKKRGKNIHLVESYPSKIKPVETTTTTTITQPTPKVAVSNVSTVVPSVPVQSSYYPMSYTSYVDPTTGLTYAYDPNWQYSPSGTGLTYDYSSYYTNPNYIQNNLPNGLYNSTVPVATESSNAATQPQEHTQTTTTVINPNPLIDKGTYTYMAKDRKKHKPTNPTVVVHTSRNPTPPTPKIIIEQPRPARLPRKLKSTTVLKERTTQTPHTTTTTYVQT